MNLKNQEQYIIMLERDADELIRTTLSFFITPP
jgi:hypothetical protein